MPPKKQITSDQIIEKAYELVKQNGCECLTARTLAKELNCSTQPIYQSFEDMNTLKATLAKKASVRMLQYIESNTDVNQPAVLSKILGYVQFANEEKYLFQLMFSPGVMNQADANGLVPINHDLELNMIVYAHGIVMMKAFGTLELPWERIREMIIKAYESFDRN